MRYIRTVDNIYERYDNKVKAIDGYIVVKPKSVLPIKGYQIVSKDRIIKESDDILDLCDGILVEEIGNESNRFIMETNELKKMSKEEIENHLTSWRFYLFIKNDRGLIYIAKINDEGEPELK
jgi:hypothetical protein